MPKLVIYLSFFLLRSAIADIMWWSSKFQQFHENSINFDTVNRKVLLHKISALNLPFGLSPFWSVVSKDV